MDETRTAPHRAATRPQEALPDDAFELVGAGWREHRPALRRPGWRQRLARLPLLPLQRPPLRHLPPAGRERTLTWTSVWTLLSARCKMRWNMTPCKKLRLAPAGPLDLTRSNSLATKSVRRPPRNPRRNRSPKSRTLNFTLNRNRCSLSLRAKANWTISSAARWKAVCLVPIRRTPA